MLIFQRLAKGLDAELCALTLSLQIFTMLNSKAYSSDGTLPAKEADNAGRNYPVGRSSD